jgi:hypothetical protein
MGYIVEYGGMPGDPVLQISASTIIVIPRIGEYWFHLWFGECYSQATASKWRRVLVHYKTGGSAIFQKFIHYTTTNTTTSYYVDGNKWELPRCT